MASTVLRRPPEPLAPPGLPILHRDEYLVAVHKPAGLLVHRTGLDPRATRFALQLLREQLQRRVFPVHRLDRPTSGLLLFALDPETARLLTQQFAEGEVTKTYLAVVRGYTEPAGEIDHALTEQIDPLGDRDVQPDQPARAAVTRYRRLATIELPWPVRPHPTARYSLLQVHPQTGRKHQIRRHLKHIFHPVIGDTRHGDGHHNRSFRHHLGCTRLLLAATGLILVHPRLGTPLTLTAAPESSFSRVLDQLGWGPVLQDTAHLVSPFPR